MERIKCRYDPIPEEEYGDAIELINALAWYLFSGVSLYDGDLLRRKAKGE